MADFILDLHSIRDNARKNMADGSITGAYRADKAKTIELLKSAMASEWICVLRYTQHQFAAEGIHAEPVAEHFAAHAAEELDHAKQLAARIKQLGGQPSMDPSKMAAVSPTEYRECSTLEEMIQENLIAERIGISVYTDMLRYIGDRDPTTYRLLESILAQEEEHADEMANLLTAVRPKTKPYSV